LDASQLANKSGIPVELDNVQIPGAVEFNLKRDFSLKSTNLPNMMLDADQFEQACKSIGINKSSKIVVYDNLGVYFSPRVWWMFKAMGHKEISVLNGGLPHWIVKGFETESKKTQRQKTGDFRSSFNENLVKNFDFIKENIRKQEFLVIDARASSRFQGTAPEPRAGIQSGNIQNSINLPFHNVLENGKFRSKEELIIIFENLKIDNHPLIFSCGSGITASIILLACELVCKNIKSVYDGSWTEWAEQTQ
jgi:thiosulfate/3-mercaptopyruvate sulfurtransferase